MLFYLKFIYRKERKVRGGEQKCVFRFFLLFFFRWKRDARDKAKRNRFRLRFTLLSKAPRAAIYGSARLAYGSAWSVQVFPALARATGAGNLDVLQREFVVVCQLFSAMDPPQGKDDDVFLAKYVDDSRIAVGLNEAKRKNTAAGIRIKLSPS